jgi:ADP-ribose pyrophosphatase YjhB (NUDIX family)
MQRSIKCPICGADTYYYVNPVPTVDIIIQTKPETVILIQRKNPPLGWALPGGFVDYGETVEQAAVREAKEETGLDITIKSCLGVFSNPERDPRLHTISTVFIAHAFGDPVAGDDAAALRIFRISELPSDMAFDHRDILNRFIMHKGNLCGI